MTVASLSPKLFLGIEGGGTSIVALMTNSDNQVVRQFEAGPANLKLLTDAQLVTHFRLLAKAFSRPDALGIGLAGAWAEPDRQRIRSAAAKVWPGIPCYATSDLETALTAAIRPQKGAPVLQVLLVSGTGSGCYGKTAEGKGVKVGAWGHLLGDKGSGYEIGLRALKAVVYYFDYERAWPRLGQRILSALQLNEPTDLIGWAQGATKAEIAGLAVEVFAEWEKNDRIASDIPAAAAHSLAQDAATCAGRLARKGSRVQFVLAGSILLKQPRFRARMGRELRKLWPGAMVTRLERESVWGAVELAKRFAGQSEVRSPRSEVRSPQFADNGLVEDVRMVRSARLSPTEARNPRSMRLDKLPVLEAIALMLSEDAKIPKQLLAEKEQIGRAVRAIERAFRREGRLFYVGAGTSGRLGVLDASECPATFRTPPEMVQGIIAGGQTALWKAVEGAEDDAGAGGRAIQFRGIDSRDVVVGIAASGTTPSCLGAVFQAKLLGP